MAGFRTVDLYDYGGDGRRVASRERGRSKYALGYVLLCLHYDNHHAWTKIFPPKKYTKYISWDILITIACAFAISKAMENSGFASMIARHIISMADDLGPYALLAIIFIITNIFTEFDHEQRRGGIEFPDRLVGGYAIRR